VYSSIAFHQSATSRRERADLSHAPDAGFYRDSRNVGLRTETRLERMGVDLGEDFQGVLDKARSGELVGQHASGEAG
jgi:hypothetical protein